MYSILHIGVLDANFCQNFCLDVDICRMYYSLQTEVLNQFLFHDVYFTAVFKKLQGFPTFNKTVAIHKIIESKKIKGYRECAKQSFSIPLIVIPSDNIIHN